jgi:hypothetical protein
MNHTLCCNRHQDRFHRRARDGKRPLPANHPHRIFSIPRGHRRGPYHHAEDSRAHNPHRGALQEDVGGGRRLDEEARGLREGRDRDPCPILQSLYGQHCRFHAPGARYGISGCRIQPRRVGDRQRAPGRHEHAGRSPGGDIVQHRGDSRRHGPQHAECLAQERHGNGRPPRGPRAARKPSRGPYRQ